MSETCSFCGKKKSKPNPIVSSNEKITGTKAYICKACAVFIYTTLFSSENSITNSKSWGLDDVPSPKS